ncbi:gluconokinase [Nocardia brevicatena]|uniref:gluconokinase n=1 Tax=Nocardia brevicatena TaxID=37327 RepID=UPI000687AA66|nr:gluconokinase [Nocardia brevicatena]
MNAGGSSGVSDRSRTPYVVVMGVTGTGKTTTGRLLATRLGVPFADADDFHSRANIAKMTSGIPLDDADREPWLASVGYWLRDREAAGTGAVVACSALKRRYRDILRSFVPGIYFLHLTAERPELLERLSTRRGHFMPVSLLDSQLAGIEPLQEGERGTVVHSSRTPAEAVEAVAARLEEHAAPPDPD